MEIKPEWALTVAASAAASIALMATFKRLRGPSASNITEGNGISIGELLDPANRADHLAFNASLLARFPDDDVIPVKGSPDGTPVFLVHRHDRVMEVIANHECFSSNPWVGSRGLVTLNTMEKPDHDRVYRLLKRFYSPMAIQGIRDMIHDLVVMHGQRFERDHDAFMFAKRLHMHLSLNTSGISPTMDPEDPSIDEFIAYNDAAVRLAAPLGGVGMAPKWSIQSVGRLLRGVYASIPYLWQLVRRIGIRQTWTLIDPLKSVFPAFPYTHCWDYPDILKVVPAYFCRLYDSMSIASVDSPAGALFSEIGKTITASEAIATAVQLMVNMTTANAIMSYFYRKCSDPNISTEDILSNDAPLQRNPRRAKSTTTIGSSSIPSGSLVLLCIGVANMTCPSGGMMATFGFGLHHCIGRHLVNMELQLVSEWLHDRRVNLIRYDRLVDVDVGNWGFSSLEIEIEA